MILAIIRFLILAPIIAVLIYWGLFNTQNFEWLYLPGFDGINVSIAIFMLIIFVLGYIAGSVLLWINMVRKPSRTKQYKTQIKDLELENKALKAQLQAQETLSTEAEHIDITPVSTRYMIDKK